MGLLDYFNSDEGRFTMGLLAAAGPMRQPMSTGQRFMGLLEGMDARKAEQEERTLRRGLLQAQVEETRAQAQQRQAQVHQAARRQSMLDAMLSGGGDLSGANADTIAQTGGLAPTTNNALVQSQAMQQRQQANPLFGIPREAIQADLALNNGQNVPQWLYKRGVPDLQVHNGVVLDLNRTRAGATLPTISQNGQASQPIPDPSAPGGFRVVMPQGAAEVYGAYREADEAAKSRHDLVRSWNPVTGREEFVSRAQALERSGQLPQRPPAQQPGQLPPSGGIPPLWRERLQADMADPRTQFSSPGVRAAVEARAGGIPMQGQPGLQQGGPMAAGPSTREASMADYDKALQRDLAERRKSIMDASDTAGTRIANLQQLNALLGQHDGGSLSPTGLQIAKAANSLGLKVDPLLPNKESAVALANQFALELRNPAGGAGMPGSLSDSDRQFLTTMVPGLATSAQGRTMMINAMVGVEQRKQQVAQFARNYEAKYGRIDPQFFTQLSAWSSANPQFGKKER